MKAIVGTCVVIAGLGVAGTYGAGPPRFVGLGDLTGQGLGSEARAVSGDGSVVVGSSGSPSGQRAFRWTTETGMAALAPPPGLGKSWAAGVSADGTFVCGFAGDSFGSPVGWEGVRWSLSGSVDRIAVPGAGVWAKGISADGQKVVGSAADEAFMWTAGGGIVGLGGLSPPPFRSNAEAVSADGQVVVGDSLNVTLGARDVFRWTQQSGMVSLGGFTATATSHDGSVVVGSISGRNFEAVRWTLSGGMASLGYYRENFDSRAYGVSGDGRIAVGYVECTLNDVGEASIWDIYNGTRILKDVLEQDYGLNLSGWSLTRAWAISDDGSTIVGRGYSPQGLQEAWVASITPPCPPEWNRDGDGAFGLPANWVGGVPNSIGATASFLGKIEAPSVVTVDGSYTLATMSFDNSNSYTLRGGQVASGVTLQAPSGNAAITVAAGQHNVEVPMVLASDTDLLAADAAVLSVSSPVTLREGKTLTKLGPGCADLVGGLVLGDGATLRVHAGSIKASAISGGAVNVLDDASLVIDGAGGAGASTISTLSIDPLGTLDLGSNDLIIRGGSPELRDRVWAWIANACNGGTWDRPGLTSTAARAQADGLTGLGMMLNRDESGRPIYDEFDGQGVDENSILVKYTFNGDATLDGTIDADDYFCIDQGFLLGLGNPGYRNGDLNYDGRVDVDDYYLIDIAFLHQSGLLSAKAAAAVSTVPEPATTAVLGLAAAWAMARRRQARVDRGTWAPPTP